MGTIRWELIRIEGELSAGEGEMVDTLFTAARFEKWMSCFTPTRAGEGGQFQFTSIKFEGCLADDESYK